MLTHRRHDDSLTDGAVILFAEDGNRNRHYGRHVWVLESDLPTVPDELVVFAASYYGTTENEASKLVDPNDIVDSAGAWDDPDFVWAAWDRFGVAGYRTYDGAVVLDRTAVELTYHHEGD